MTLVRAVDDPAYLPDHGTLMIRDRRTPGGTPARPPLASSVLAESDGSVDPTGTIARTGNGWLAAVAGDDRQAVRLEFHDHVPTVDDDEWDEIVETPYFCGTGAVEVAWLTGSAGLPGIELASPGLYRVRACRSTGRWLFRFASTNGAISPPRWVRRRERRSPGSDQSEAPIHHDERSLSADLLSIVAWGESLATSLRDLADRLLVPAAVVSGVLDDTVRKGMVVHDGDLDGEFRLSLSPGELATTAAAPPSLGQPTRSTPAARSGRRPSRTDWPGPALEPDLVAPGASEASSGPRLRVVGGPSRPTDPAESPPDAGPPPRAGIIAGDGSVVRWHDGEPEVVGRLRPEPWHGALECAFGVVVLGVEAAVLVRPGGQVDELGGGHAPRFARVSEDGRFVAYVERDDLGQAPARVHVVDLADGSRETLTPEPSPLWVAAMHAGAVYVAVGSTAPRGSLRWVPGEEPTELAHLVRRVDPLTGTRMVAGTSSRARLERPDGTLVDISAPPTADLAPGSARLYTVGASEPTVTVIPIANAADSVVLPLPMRRSRTAMGAHAWEDAEHLLILTGPRMSFWAPVFRVNVSTGAVENAALRNWKEGMRTLVEPLLGH